MAKQHLDCFWPRWNIGTLISIIGDKLLVSHFLVKMTAEKRSENSQDQIVSQSSGSQGKTNDNCIFLDILSKTFQECVCLSMKAWTQAVQCCSLLSPSAVFGNSSDTRLSFQRDRITSFRKAGMKKEKPLIQHPTDPLSTQSELPIPQPLFDDRSMNLSEKEIIDLFEKMMVSFCIFCTICPSWFAFATI